MDAQLYEASFSAAPVQESDGSNRKGIWNIKLISSDVQGSSGYYPREVLERDGPLVFPKGTQVYFDHPAEDEEWKRPERSVRDMAGVFETGATFLQNGSDGPGLYANVRLFSEADKWMEEAKDAIGMSIRASGTVAETDTGYTITSLAEGHSVDIVTRAGAGGKVLQLMENARNGAPQGGGAAGADVTALSEKLDALTAGQKTTNEALKGLVDVLKENAKPVEQKVEEGLTTAQIVAKLDEAELPPVCRKRLAESYKAGDDFDAMIKAEKEYADQVMESAKGQKKAGYRSVSSAQGGSGVLEESAASQVDKEFNDIASLLQLGEDK